VLNALSPGWEDSTVLSGSPPERGLRALQTRLCVAPAPNAAEAMSKLSKGVLFVAELERPIRLRPNPSSAPTYVHRGISGTRVTAAPPSAPSTGVPGIALSPIPTVRRSQRPSLTSVHFSVTVPPVVQWCSFPFTLRLASGVVTANRRIVAPRFVSPRRRQTSLAIVPVFFEMPLKLR
jgi:hypothetical protein